MGAYWYVGHPAVEHMVEQAFSSAGWKRAEHASDAEVAVSYCLGPSELEDAYFEERGLVKLMPSGSLLIDLSPATPGLSREIAAVATVNDLEMVEAPLVVIKPCSADTLSNPESVRCLVAGEDESVQRAMPLLQLIAGDVVRVGLAGSAQMARAALSIQRVATLVAAIETDVLRFQLGGNDRDAFDRVMAEAAPSDEVQQILQAIRERRFDGAYTLEMLMVELAIAVVAADEEGFTLPQAEGVMNVMQALAIAGAADMSASSLGLAYCSEEDGVAEGLDWTRVQAFYGQGMHNHAHGDGHGHEGDDYGYGDPDGFDGYFDDFDDGDDDGLR